MLKSATRSVIGFTSKHRLQVIITLALVVAFALVFASVTTAQYDPAQQTAAAVRHAPAPRELHCSVNINGYVYSGTIESGKTVADFLDRLGISFSKNSIVTPGLDAVLNKDVMIDVTHVESFTVVEEITIPYITTTVEDPDMYVGNQVIDVAGRDGTLAVTSCLVFHDGECVLKEELETELVTKPVDEVLRVGAKEYDIKWDASGNHCDPRSFVVSDTGNGSGGGTITLADGTQINYSSIVNVSATAYTTERQSFKYTYTGTIAHEGGIAVDRSVIPLGTEMYIVGADGTWTYGYAKAEDLGGGIKGHKVDLFYDTYNECIYFGVRNAKIYIIG